MAHGLSVQFSIRTIQQEHRQHVQMLESDSGLTESSFALILVGLPSGQWARYFDELAIDSALKGRKSLREKTRGSELVILFLSLGILIKNTVSKKQSVKNKVTMNL